MQFKWEIKYNFIIHRWTSLRFPLVPFQPHQLGSTILYLFVSGLTISTARLQKFAQTGQSSLAIVLDHLDLAFVGYSLQCNFQNDVHQSNSDS